jgi:hypothetical protein
VAKSDAAYLESLKLARDAITEAMEDGSTVIEYQIAGRKKVTADPAKTLTSLIELIEIHERKSQRSSSSPYRLIKLNRPS